MRRGCGESRARPYCRRSARHITRRVLRDATDRAGQKSTRCRRSARNGFGLRNEPQSSATTSMREPAVGCVRPSSGSIDGTVEPHAVAHHRPSRELLDSPPHPHPLRCQLYVREARRRSWVISRRLGILVGDPRVDVGHRHARRRCIDMRTSPVLPTETRTFGWARTPNPLPDPRARCPLTLKPAVGPAGPWTSSLDPVSQVSDAVRDDVRAVELREEPL